MPGPVSDQYDPEFGTAEAAADVTHALEGVRKRLDLILGEEVQDIVQVTRRWQRKRTPHAFTERELRLIRFSINRALESI